MMMMMMMQVKNYSSSNIIAPYVVHDANLMHLRFFGRRVTILHFKKSLHGSEFISTILLGCHISVTT
jgi:hypothetical protein